MRDYQRKVNNPYYLPKTLYRRVLSVIRDYDRQVTEIQDVLYGTADRDGVTVAGGRCPKPTESAAIRLAQYENDTEAVEQALAQLPEEYRKGVFRNIVYGDKFPLTAHYNTWWRWKQKFVWYVAKNLYLI